MTPSPTSGRVRDERGTSLILAVVFVFVIGILLVSLGGFAANALLNTSNGRQQRTTTADAENAVTIAMQYLRYTPAATSTLSSCLPPSSTIPSSDPRVNLSHSPVQVYCQQDVFPTQAQSRVVQFYACGWNVTAANCSVGNQTVLLHAEVAYNDLNPQGVDNCYPITPPPPVTTSCGMAMTVNTWDVIGADN
jgi:hypothetical protein